MFPDTQSLGIIGLSVFGLTLALLGLGWLLAGSRLGERERRRLALGMAGLSGPAAGATWALDVPEWLWQPLLALVPVGLLVALACSSLPGWLARRGLAGLARCAPAQALVMLLGGLVLTGSQLWRIEQGLQSEMNRSEAELGLLGEPADLSTHPSLVVRTDGGQPIPLFVARGEAPTDTVADAERRYLQQARLELKLIQTATVDASYNCHGWVFAGGRFWVRSTFVRRILEDNGYRATEQVTPGDVAVYRAVTGEVSHTGLVRSVNEAGQVLIESKWGRLGRYIHTAEDHAYRGHQVTYYRTARGNHHLQGLSNATPVAQPSDL